MLPFPRTPSNTGIIKMPSQPCIPGAINTSWNRNKSQPQLMSSQHLHISAQASACGAHCEEVQTAKVSVPQQRCGCPSKNGEMLLVSNELRGLKREAGYKGDQWNLRRGVRTMIFAAMMKNRKVPFLVSSFSLVQGHLFVLIYAHVCVIFPESLSH